MRLSLFLVTCLFLFSCEETTMTKMGARINAWPVVEVHRWEIVGGTEMVGILKLLRVQQPDLGEEYYQVQRADGQVCGEIDRRGRGWRYEPFKKDMVFIGMGSMEENCGKLLEVEGKVALKSWNKKAAAEATMRREAREKATSTEPRERATSTEPLESKPEKSPEPTKGEK